MINNTSLELELVTAVSDRFLDLSLSISVICLQEVLLSIIVF